MITDSQIQQFHEEGYFILESAVDEATLQHLRDFSAQEIERMHRSMDEAGSDTLGINHRDSRYFIPHSFREHPENYRFVFGEVMEAICRATVGDTAKFFLDQYVIKAAAALPVPGFKD